MPTAAEILRAEAQGTATPSPAEILRREAAPDPTPPSNYQEDLTPPGGPYRDVQAIGARNQATAEQFQAEEPQRRAKHFNDLLKGNGISGEYAGVEDLPSGLSFIMARSRSMRDMREKFEQKYPEGDLMPAPGHEGGTSFLFRKDPTDDWHEVNTNQLSFLSGKVATPQTAAAIGAGVLTGGGSALAQGAAVGAATALGSLADYGLERGFGYAQDENVYQAGGAALKEGVIAGGAQGTIAAGPAAAALGRKALNFKLSDVLVPNKEYGAGFVTAAEQEGLPLPTAGQVSGSPLIRSKYGQVAGTSATARAPILEQNAGLKNALERKIEATGYGGASPEQLQRLMDLQEGELTNALLENVPGNRIAGVESSEAGQAYQEGLRKFEQTSQVMQDGLYRKANNFVKEDEGHFNVSPLQKTWEDMKKGVWAPTQDVAAAEDAGIQVAKPSAALQAIGKKIEGVSYNLRNFTKEGKTSSAFEQLQSIRSDLIKMVNSGPPEQRQAAQTLLDQTKEIMDTPIGVTPETGQLIKQANDFATAREEKLAMFSGALNAKDPSNLGFKVIRPDNFNTLATLKEAAPDQFETVAQGFRNNLLQNPEKIKTTLDAFKRDSKTIGLVMEPEEQEAWRSYGRSWKAWNNQKVQETLKAQLDDASSAVDVIMGSKPGMGSSGRMADPKELSQLVSRIGGADSQTAGSLRAGLYRRLLDDNVETSAEQGGSRLLKADKLVGDIDKLLTEDSRRRLDPIMRPQDWQSLENFAVYAKMIASTKPSGQIQTANIAQRVFSTIGAAAHPEAWALASAQILNNETFAKILSQPVSSRLFYQAIDAGPSAPGVRMLTGALTTALRDVKKVPEEQTDDTTK